MRMKLTERIDHDLIAAQKAREARRVSTLRMLKAGLMNLAIEKRQPSLDDGDVTALLQRQVKQRRESIAAYQQGGRQDLVQQEQEELAILEQYLPKQLDDGELRQTIKQHITAVGAQGMADMGKVMKAVMAAVQGRADGSKVSALVKECLQQHAA